MPLLRGLISIFPMMLIACGDGGDGDSTTSGTLEVTGSSASDADASTSSTEESSSESSDGCTPGASGCACVGGECLGNDLACQADICQPQTCEPDPSLNEDPDNCGECGLACRFDRHLGARCDSGDCPPATSPCFETPMSCAEACTLIGESCVQQGCPRVDSGPGHTYYSFFNAGSCETAVGGSTTDEVDAGCDVPTQGASHYRCCCTDSGTQP